MNLRIDLRACAAILLAVALVASAAGRATGAASVVGSPTPASADSAAVITVDDIRRELAAAQSQLASIEAAGPAAGAPPGTPAVESSDRRTLARHLVSLYQQQLEALDHAEAAAAQRAAAERDEREWTGFATAPPLSVMAIDALRDTADAAAARIGTAAARQSLLGQFATDVEPRLKASQAAARLAAEAADAARGTPQSARAEWQRSLAVLRARVDVAMQGVIDIGLRGAREDATAAKATYDLARRQLATAGRSFALSDADLALVYADIDQRLRSARREQERAEKIAAAADEARTAAELRLARLRATALRDADGPERAQRETEAATEATLRREAAATAALRADMLNDYQLVLSGERMIWDARQEALGTQDPVRARTFYERLIGGLASVRARRQYFDQELAAAAARISETEAKLRGSDAAEAARLQPLLDTLRERESVMREAIRHGESVERLIAHFRADLEGKREASLAEEARNAAALAVLRAKRLWNYELLTVQDVFETAEGRKLNVSRAITVGKSIGAVLILLVGYGLMRWLMRRTERVLVGRGHLAPQSAALLRSWVLLAATLVLVVFALTSASIPITVFAFLGGALAIAAGFGLQTLLKNLVAGVILLFERPMRLGDLVDVDGVQGRVTAIGIRASTIRTADGIESLIPNSAFLEHKLTNWTYSNPLIRQTMAIGVEYGTPLRKAADVLGSVIARHRQVLQHPAPQVYLDGYADSAVRFALAYWVELTPENDTQRIRSDLLYMIDSAFAESGMRMPFPQIDVHLDAAAQPEASVGRRAAGPASALESRPSLEKPDRTTRPATTRS